MKKPLYEELEDALLKVTAIAHYGGLANMSEDAALRAVRRVTRNLSAKLAKKSNEDIKELIENS